MATLQPAVLPSEHYYLRTKMTDPLGRLTESIILPSLPSTGVPSGIVAFSDAIRIVAGAGGHRRKPSRMTLSRYGIAARASLGISLMKSGKGDRLTSLGVRPARRTPLPEVYPGRPDALPGCTGSMSRLCSRSRSRPASDSQRQGLNRESAAYKGGDLSEDLVIGHALFGAEIGCHVGSHCSIRHTLGTALRTVTPRIDMRSLPISSPFSRPLAWAFLTAAFFSDRMRYRSAR